MPELRKDPIVDRWTIIAPERALRPTVFRQVDAPADRGPCDFCEGHEGATPPESFAVRAPGTLPDRPGWRVRVAPNSFPAVRLDAKIEGIDEPGAINDGLHRSLPGFGMHEVFIESPEHVVSVTELAVDHFRDVLVAYRHRLLVAKADRRFKSGLIFKNVGGAGGATLAHVHSQLIALPLTPGFLADEIESSRRLHAASGRCPYCQLLESERAAGARMVLDTPDFAAFCPHAARTPYETWLLPTAHASHFEETSDAKLANLAQALHHTLTAIEGRLERLAYNYVIHTGPFDTPALGHYHWHIEVIPRVTTIAGFEWGTGCAINPLPPERAARLLADGRR